MKRPNDADVRTGQGVPSEAAGPRSSRPRTHPGLARAFLREASKRLDIRAVQVDGN